MKSFEVNIPMFSPKCRIIFCDLGADSKKLIKKHKLPEDLPYDHIGTAMGSTITRGFTAIVYFDMPFSKITPNLVAHECFHVASNFCSHAGIKLVEESEEVYAYLLDYIIYEFYTKLKNAGVSRTRKR